MNKVSIIVPVYNAQSTISKCIDSILSQSYKNIEVILLNDGSKDKSIEILKEYEKDNDNIIVINKKNSGVASTRNQGIKVATGKYIMFVDNDDFIDRDYVLKYVNKINSNKSDIVIGGYRRVNTSNKVMFQKKLIDSEWSKYIIMAPWAKIFKRKYLIDNKIEFLSYPIGEDVYFMMMCFYNNASVSTIDYIGYNWFYNDLSISNTVQRGLQKDVDIVILLDKIKKFSNSNYTEYYLYRYFVWYMLFSGKNSNKNKFHLEYKRIKKWFADNNIKISLFSTNLKGESFSHRASVIGFRLIEKLHLINIFASIYCRGDKNEK